MVNRTRVEGGSYSKHDRYCYICWGISVMFASGERFYMYGTRYTFQPIRLKNSFFFYTSWSWYIYACFGISCIFEKKRLSLGTNNNMGHGLTTHDKQVLRSSYYMRRVYPGPFFLLRNACFWNHRLWANSLKKILHSWLTELVVVSRLTTSCTQIIHTLVCMYNAAAFLYTNPCVDLLSLWISHGYILFGLIVFDVFYYCVISD